MNKLRNLNLIRFFGSITFLTAIWFLGSLIFLPQKAMALTAGDLIKSTESSAVYYLGADNKKYVFPDEKVYFSWYEDFSLVHIVSQDTFQSYQTTGNVKMRAGTKLIQFVAIGADGSMIVDDPKVYALELNGVRRWIETAEIAEELYGSDWETNIYGCPNTLIDNYTTGESISSATYPTGSVVQDSTGIYYFNEEGDIQELTSEGLDDNMFQDNYIIEATQCLTCFYSTGTTINSTASDLISLTAGTPANLPENIYVVSTLDGDDNNPGTFEEPFKTVSKAAEVAQAGDAVYIRAGVYEETVTVQNSGSADKMIVFTHHPLDDNYIVEVKGTDGYGFYLGEGVDYIRINGLKISRGLGGGVVTNVYNQYKNLDIAHGAGIKLAGSHDNEIANNIIYDNDIGIFVSPYPLEEDAATNNLIAGNTIYNNGEAGIRVKRSDYTTIEGNTIYHNGHKDYIVYSEPSPGIAYYCTIGTIIKDNTIYDNTSMAIQNYAGTGSETCDAVNSLIKENILSQTYVIANPGTIYDGYKIVLTIAEKEIIDNSHVYQLNDFYNGDYGSKMVAWGANNTGTIGELLTVNEFNEQAAVLNPNSGDNKELQSNPIE